MIRRPRTADLLLLGSILFFGAALGYRASHSLQPPPASEPRPVLRAGEEVRGFWRDLGWDAPPEGPTLVVFYTAECPWCRLSVRRWNRLREEVLEIPGARAVAVSLSDSAASREYPGQTGFAFPLFLPTDVERIEARWKVAAVPYTVVVEPDGRVKGAWKGAVDSLQHNEIRRVLAGA